jgi:hypothetical protein
MDDRYIEEDKEAGPSIVPALIVIGLIAIGLAVYFFYSYYMKCKEYEDEHFKRTTIESNFISHVSYLNECVIRCGTNTNDFIIIYGVKFRKVVE